MLVVDYRLDADGYDSVLITAYYPRGGRTVLFDGQGIPKIPPPRHIPKTPDPGYFT
jgi:hypothetical protein